MVFFTPATGSENINVGPEPIPAEQYEFKSVSVNMILCYMYMYYMILYNIVCYVIIPDSSTLGSMPSHPQQHGVLHGCGHPLHPASSFA